MTPSSPLHRPCWPPAGARHVSRSWDLDDVGQDGMKLIAEIMNVLDNYDFETEVIVASVRDPIHVVEAAQLGPISLPYLTMCSKDVHALTDVGIKRFQDDWAKVPKK